MTNSTATSESELAKRLRDIRTRKNWTLEQTSKASGVAASTLSKIENGHMSPTYDILLKLAKGLDMDLAELFTATQEHMGSGRLAITRNGEGKPHATPMYDHLLLCSQISHKRMMPFVTNIRKFKVSEKEGWSKHEGEEFIYVLSGSIQLHTEYYEPEILNEGDCFYIDSRMGHRVINQGTTEAKVLWISTKINVD